MKITLFHQARSKTDSAWLSLPFCIPGFWLASKTAYTYLTQHEGALSGIDARPLFVYASIHFVFFTYALFLLLRSNNQTLVISIKVLFNLLTLVILFPAVAILVESLTTGRWLTLGGAASLVLGFLLILSFGWVLIHRNASGRSWASGG